MEGDIGHKGGVGGGVEEEEEGWYSSCMEHSEHKRQKTRPELCIETTAIWITRACKCCSSFVVSKPSDKCSEVGGWVGGGRLGGGRWAVRCGVSWS